MQPAADGLSSLFHACLSMTGNTRYRQYFSPALTSGQAVKEELMRQLCNSVRWQSSMEYIIAQGISTFIEIGPGNVLTGS